MMLDIEPVFIDFEASSLSDLSYPIEVAWGANSNETSSFLINPENVADWTDWNFEAEHEAHQISREKLIADGLEPHKVVAHLMTNLSGRAVYSDAPLLDNFWLTRLFNAVGQVPNFHIQSALTLIYERIAHQVSLNASHISLQTLEKEYQNLRQQAWDNIGLKPHRAENDVKCMLELFRLANL